MLNSWFGRGGVLGVGLMAAAVVGSLAYGITEEVKFGDVEGEVLMKTNGKALPNARVILQPRFELPDKIKWSPKTRTDEQGHFHIKGIPAGPYEVQVYGKAHSASDKQVVVFDGREASTTVVTELSVPELDLSVSQRVLAKGESPKFEISGVTREPSVKLSVFQIGAETYKKIGALYDITRSLTTGVNQTNPALTPGIKLVRKQTVKVDTMDVEGAFAETETLSPLPEGLYILQASHGKQTEYAWLTVTDLALITKTVDKDILAYAVDIKSGAPVANAPVSLYINGGGKEVGKTDPNGVCKFTRPKLGTENSFVVAAQRGASTAFTWMRSWDDSTPDSGVQSKLWVKPDRPIYRPGDEIQYKGIARTVQGTGYGTPTSGSVEVIVYDPDEQVISKSSLTVSRFGTFNGKFTTPPDLPGTYRVHMKIGASEESQYFQVINFRKPEYTVTVTPSQKVFRKGDELRAKVKAEYYTGEPLVGAPVTVRIEKALIYDSSPFEDNYSPFRTEESGDYVGEVTAKTDGSGEATITFRPPQDETRSGEAYDAKFIFNADVADPSERYFSGQGTALVTRGLIGIKSELGAYYVERDSAMKVNSEVVNHESDKPEAGLELKATLIRRRWTRQADNEYKEVETPLEHKSATTNPEGKAEFTFSPSQEGDYLVLVEANDRAGTRVVSENNFWCGSAGWEGSFSEASFKMIADKETFDANEDVKGIIQTDSPGGSALLTVEGSEIIQAKVVPLDHAVTRFNLGPLGKIAPGAEVHAVYIRGKEYHETSTTVKVSLAARTLNLDVVPDRKEAKPGEQVTYTLHASDDKGSPVRADLSLGVVDEGIYQIAEDTDDPLNAFYQPQYSQVQTEFSFPEIYLDGEDKASPKPQIRTTFKDTAHWEPSVITDANGQAKVTVTMPDNLTSWRATVMGITGDTRLGQAKVNVVVKKDLMARISPPAFMVQEDTQNLGAVVSNTTDSEQRVKVKLEVDGLGLSGENSKEISVAPRSSQRVDWPIEAQKPGEAKVQVTAIADKGLDDGLEMKFPVLAKAKRVVSTLSGDLIAPPTSGDPDAVKSFKVTGNSAEFKLQNASGSLSGDLVVRVDPSPLATLLDYLPTLVDFPYGCVEQTLSKFQPAIAAKRFADATGVSIDLPKGRMDAVTKEGLRRLRKMQHGDGGWGWWEYDETSSLMTGAVLEGLKEAADAGVKVDQAMVTRGLQWADSRLKGPRVVNWDNNTPYLAYARLLWSPSPRAVTAISEEADLVAKTPNDKVSLEQLASLSLYLRQAGLTEKGAATFERLAKRVREDKGLVLSEQYFWGETRGRVLQAYGEYVPAGLESTSLLLAMLSERKSLDQLGTRCVARIINGALVLLRNSSVLESELKSTNGTIEVTVAGKSKGSQSLGREAVMYTIPTADLPEGEVAIKIEAQGVHPLFRATINQMVATQSFPAEDSPDFTITRTYHRVKTTPQEDGTLKREIDPNPTTTFKSGEIFKVKVVVKAQSTLNYVLIEDPIPSNCVAVDTDDPYNWSNWSYWWDRTTTLKDKTAFFKRSMDKGEHEFEYSIRAESIGESLALPAKMNLFYNPVVPASSTGEAIKVTQ